MRRAPPSMERTLRRRRSHRRSGPGPRVWIPALLLTFGVGCGESMVEPVPDASALRVEIVAEVDTVRGVDTLDVRVSATNPTDREISVVSAGPLFGLRVGPPRSGGGGDQLFDAKPIGGGPGDTVRFAPGATRDTMLSWVSGPPPGIRELRGVFRAPEPPSPMSDPVLIRVLPTLDLAAAVEPIFTTPGRGVDVTVTLRNLDDRPVTIPDPSASCEFGVWIERDGDFVERLSSCPLTESATRLAGRSAIRTTFSWTPAEPGDYRAVARLDVPEIQPTLRHAYPFMVR